MTTWTEDKIVALIDTNAHAVTRAVIAIYKRQTDIEQNVRDTREQNGVGFNSADARKLSYYAQWALNNNKDLNGKFLVIARQRIKKYRRQLVEIANSK
jgi:hypothetical protein